MCKVMKNPGARENHSSLGPSVKAWWGGIRTDTGVLGRKYVCGKAQEQQMVLVVGMGLPVSPEALGKAAVTRP